jgi:hypothetical protein
VKKWQSMFMILAMALATIAWADGRGHPQSLDDCSASQTIVLNSDINLAQSFYTSSTAPSNCGRRPSPDKIFELSVREAGLYSIVVPNQSIYLYLTSECCGGDQLFPRGMVLAPFGIQCMWLDLGVYYLTVEGTGELNLYITTCEEPCTGITEEDGFTFEGDQVVFVETVDANSGQPNYDGPWQSEYPPCQDPSANEDGDMVGFGYYNWYNQDFGWLHFFSTEGLECQDYTVDSAFVVICSYDNDNCIEGPAAEAAYCEWDVVYFNENREPQGVLNQDYGTGTNLSHSQTWIPVDAFDLENGEIEVFVNIDAGSNECAWATTIISSKLVVYGTCRQIPPGPDGYDLGDLPSLNNQEEPCYPTHPVESGGPGNAVFSAEQQVAWMGECVTHEQFPNTVDNDACDDGIIFVPSDHNGGSWMPGERVCVDVTVTTGPAYVQGTPLYLWGWKDGNLDCDFDDFFLPQQGDDTIVISECIIPGYVLYPEGPNSVWTERICFTDPGVLDMGRYDGYLRFRLLSCGGETPQRNGDLLDCSSAQTYIDEALGETEDYIVTDLQLPVELVSFTANGANGRMLLNWITATEHENDAFEVQKWETSGWRQISGIIPGAGTSASAHNYVFVDQSASVGESCRYRLVTIDVNGNRMPVSEVEGSVEPANTVVEQFALHQNYPNPFNPSTQISYDLASGTNVSLKVFDLLGREVATLVNGAQTAGRYTVSFDAATLPSGMYFYRLETATFTDMKKMMLLK